MIASNPANTYVVVAYEERRNTGLYGVEIYSTSGEFERRIKLNDVEQNIRLLKGMTVTSEGRIALAVQDANENYKVVVFLKPADDVDALNCTLNFVLWQNALI